MTFSFGKLCPFSIVSYSKNARKKGTFQFSKYGFAPPLFRALQPIHTIGPNRLSQHHHVLMVLNGHRPHPHQLQGHRQSR